MDAAPDRPPPDGAVTRLLLDLAGGDDAARERLYPAVYDELRRLARRQLRRERDSHTLATTDLVHEAYLRLVDVQAVPYADRAHFFALAARMMRRVLVDWARARAADKRQGGLAVTLDGLGSGEPGAPVRPDEVLALDEALVRLAARAERPARVVECRFFAGMSVEETAAALGVSDRTVKADWQLARLWLAREMASA